MREVEASLNIEVTVDCPECDNSIDLMMDNTRKGGRYYDQDSGVISQACPDGCWDTEHKKFEIDEIYCDVCETIFKAKGLGW